MTTESEALDRIAALHGRSSEATHGSDDEALYECEGCGQDWPCETAIILGGVTSGAVPPQGIDPRDISDCIWVATRAPREQCDEAARNILARLPHRASTSIDREHLDDEILGWYLAQKPDLDLADLGDRILALVRPVEGVVFDREKARPLLRRFAFWDDPVDEDAVLDALAECVLPAPLRASA